MKSTKIKYYSAVILLLTVISASLFFFILFEKNKASEQVAYVNLERVFAEHPAKAAAETKLNQKAAQYQQQLEKEAAELSGSEQKELLKSYQKELENLEAQLLASVLKEVENIIIKTADEKELKFVLEKKMCSTVVII